MRGTGSSNVRNRRGRTFPSTYGEASQDHVQDHRNQERRTRAVAVEYRRWCGWAQTPRRTSVRTGYCNGGLSTLTGSFARFHVALDDDSSEPGIFVVMRFIDQAGAVFKSRTATIGAGGSATLEYRGPSVLYRVQAEISNPAQHATPPTGGLWCLARDGSRPLYCSRRRRVQAHRPRSDEGCVQHRPDVLTDSRCRRQWVGPPYVASSLV